MLVPASKPNNDLCKVIVSGGILGYPSAALINWKSEFHDEKLSAGGSHIAKIAGVYKYLEGVSTDQDDDLVLLVDGYDTWFQLRPQTLLDRYFDINRRADERIRETIGEEVAQKHDISQKIVFSGQKQCWPWKETDPACYAVPDSTLPTDIYGPETDLYREHDKNPYEHIRQRFLNSGVAIGQVKAMRALFKEAKIRVERDPNFGSDQFIISEIQGEQEVYREVLRRQSAPWSQRLSASYSGAVEPSIFKESDIKSITRRMLNTTFEYGIGIDYESSISLATVWADNDTEWITSSNETQKQEVNRAFGLSDDQSRIKRLPWDIVSTNPPPQSSWEDVPLMTDILTGFAPAIIHHNAWQDGMKSRRYTWWDRIWFQKRARVLYSAHMTAPPAPIAFAGPPGGERVWWSAEDRKGGASDAGGSWFRFKDLCNGTEDGIFRDSRGPWITPEGL
ncbi:hypothetical protein MBLNU459_g5019t2 [Dothideomycetes sp. NU459]